MDSKSRILAAAITLVVVISTTATIAYVLSNTTSTDLDSVETPTTTLPPGTTTTTPPETTTTTPPETTTEQPELKIIIPLNQLLSGGPPKDGIPSIDNPRFLEPNEVDFLSDTDFVVGVNYNGISKAYPLMILVWHEIVNDWIGDTPVSVTYCPLCWSSITFVRVVNGETVEFGTSGRLYNSDLVMYDRQEGADHLKEIGRDLTDAGNLWSQMLGQAVIGPLAGEKLARIPTDVMYYGDWLSLHPDTVVLGKETGFNRAYGVDPYGGYYTSSRLFFPVANNDDRLSLKTKIYGIEFDGQFKAYPISMVTDNGVINDVLQDRGIAIFTVGSESRSVRGFESDVDDMRLTFEANNEQIIDQETNSVWNEHGVAIDGPLTGTTLTRISSGHIAFWFAWAAFYPETEVLT